MAVKFILLIFLVFLIVNCAGPGKSLGPSSPDIQGTYEDCIGFITEVCPTLTSEEALDLVSDPLNCKIYCNLGEILNSDFPNDTQIFIFGIKYEESIYFDVYDFIYPDSLSGKEF